MNEEIKAIRGIDEIPVFSWNTKTKEFYVLGHKFDGINSIEDFIRYITNLQQENEFLKLNNPEMNIEHFRIIKENKRKIDNLRKENKILKENAEHNDKVVDKARWNEMIYKSRCKKAIEYIMTELITEWDIENNGCVSGSDLPTDSITPLLNILNGVDENE